MTLKGDFFILFYIEDEAIDYYAFLGDLESSESVFSFLTDDAMLKFFKS